MKKNPFVYYGKKLLIFLVSVFILSVAVFYISRLAPGDPLMSYYGERVEKMSVAEKDAAREKLGLNDPIHIQYIRWVENAAKVTLAFPLSTSRMLWRSSVSESVTP